MSKSWKNIINKINKTKFKEKFDTVLAVGNGGIIPGVLISTKLKLPLEILWIKFKDENNNIIFKNPKFIKKTNFILKDKNILIVDDRSKTGKTLIYSKKYLEKHGTKINKTFVVNGIADYSLFNEQCFKFPWEY